MTDRGEPTSAGSEPDPRLADLAEEITRRLQSGEAVDVDAYAKLHPDRVGPIRALLPTMHDLIELGRTVARERRAAGRSDHSHPSASEN
jgi:eukaryotic-like serine/threonine-protein kinase